MAAPLVKVAVAQLAPQLPEHGGRIAAALVLCLLGAPMGLLLLAGGVSGNQCAALSSTSAALSPHAKKAIPGWLVPVYLEAALKFKLGREGWAYLAAVDLVENGYEGERGSQTSHANAQGPMQFLPSTWARYKQDGDGDGRAEIQNHRDAIFAAANYLRASGAPDWQRALFSYNHAQSYVDKVTAIALDYLGEDTEGATRFVAAGPADCSCAAGAVDDGDPGRGGARLPERAPKLRWPTATRTISSPFGMRWGRLHAGIDVPVPTGTPLHAAAAGRVTQAGPFGGYGNYSCFQHARALATCYAHQSRIRVKTGEDVGAGQLIGLAGNTGHSFGAHLHFEVRLGQGFAGRPVDPRRYLGGAQGPASAPAGGGGACSRTTPVSAIGGGSLLWPTAGTRGRVIGWPYQGTHTLGNWQSDNAIDIAVPAGTPLVAVADGVICPSCGFGGPVGSGLGRFDGMRLTLNIAGNQLFYKHIKRFAPGIRPGARVRRGELIGYSWSANGVPHLHIGVRSGSPRALFGIAGSSSA